MPGPVEDYEYDTRGNRTSKATGAVETYTYDSQNRLIGCTSPTTTATYAYDALDRRIAKTVDGVTEAWVYDTADLGDSTASNTALTFRAGALVKRWLFGPQTDEPLAYEAYSGTTAPGSGSVIELLANRLGSIITAISVSTGAVAADYDYQAYGARVETGALEQPYGFTGREHDAESGLLHYRARAYDPEAGLFLQIDPIEFQSGAFGLYGYVSADPLNFDDPSGLAKGSIRKPGPAGPATTEFNLLGAFAEQAREEAIGKIAEAALDLLLSSMTQARATLKRGKYSPVRRENHHCIPRSVGGSDSKANLAKIRRIRHMYVHKLMRIYMAPFRTKGTIANAFIGMDLDQGWSKAEVATIAKQFYRDIDAMIGVGVGGC